MSILESPDSHNDIFDAMRNLVAGVKRWIKKYGDVTQVPVNKNLEDLVAPFATLVRWIDSLYKLLLQPLMNILHSVAHQDAKKSGWEDHDQLLRNILNLGALLEEFRSTGNVARLVKYWKDQIS